MADLDHVICFRCGPELKEELMYLSDYNRRKLSDVVRLLLEWALEKKKQEDTSRGKV